MKQLNKWLGLLSVWVALAAVPAWAEDKVTVYAAASLTNAMGEIAGQFEKAQGIKVTGSYAGSSTLAKQIENGAPADIFVSADLKWMDYLQGKGKVDAATRKNLLANRLVLIAPKGRAFALDVQKPSDLSKTFEGRLCTGDLESVPVGIYAKQAMVKLNWWQGIKSRIVGTQDVRAALAFVERGECGAGIVYETDAKISGKVEVVARLPEDSHDRVVYPVALVAGGKPQAKAFLDYLVSPAADEVFLKYGFSLIKQ